MKRGIAASFPSENKPSPPTLLVNFSDDQLTRRELLVGGSAIVVAGALPGVAFAACAKYPELPRDTTRKGEGSMTTITTKVKVTVVEPGGFRTDFAGYSTELREGRPEYDTTVGATARFESNYDDKQPGDPVKAAVAVIRIASLAERPLRLLLGSDAYNAAEKHALHILASDREWKDVSISTDLSFYQR